MKKQITFNGYEEKELLQNALTWIKNLSYCFEITSVKIKTIKDKEHDYNKKLRVNVNYK